MKKSLTRISPGFGFPDLLSGTKETIGFSVGSPDETLSLPRDSMQIDGIFQQASNSLFENSKTCFPQLFSPQNPPLFPNFDKTFESENMEIEIFIMAQ